MFNPIAWGNKNRKWKFSSRLTALQNRKLDNGLVTTLCTYMPRGKKYPYASVKRNGYKDVVDGLVLKPSRPIRKVN